MLITVIVLAHNQARWLDACLASVANCGHAPLQVLLVDDGSTDGSADILTQWADRLGAEALILVERPEGNCRAFNRALAQARGEYVVDLAGDDALVPGALAERVRLLSESPSDPPALVYANALYVDAQEQTLGRHHPPNAHPPEGLGLLWRFYEGTFICPSTAMFHRERLMTFGGYDERLAFEDFDAWTRLVAAGGRVAYHDVIATRHRRSGPGSLSRRLTGDRAVAMLESTVLLADKALKYLNATPPEELARARRALAHWLRYHRRLATYAGQAAYAKALNDRLATIGQGRPMGDRLWQWAAHVSLIGALYRVYARWREGRYSRLHSAAVFE